MASSSSSSIPHSFKYDVFLSFRGEDTRKNFVGHLYEALKQKGIETYKDDQKIDKGERINHQLLKSIEESRFYIIVFSKNYASSSWCLDELVKIIECQKMTEHTAFPVFHDVEPTQVRKQSGAVKKAFSKHKKKKGAGKWRDAMKELADLAGWELKATANGDESKVIQIIVDDIFNKKRSTNSCIDGKLVGMETRIRDVLSSLEIGSEDVRMIGIKGMGGAGKTTLARAVYDQISNHFEAKSFVDNVREVSQPSLSGLKKLQKQILKDVLNKNDISVSSVHDGKIMLKDMMSRRKTLVVLDDVDCIEQLEALAGEPNWFKSGSRLIITTRDEQVLLAHRVKFVHDVNLLSSTEGICLFSRYAFQTEIPTRGYEELSGQVVQYAHGLRYLGMHDHLEEMGRNIVCRLHRDEPQRHSRLGVNEEIEHILTNNLGTPETKCLYFHSPFFSAEIAIKGLAKMKELRYIDISLIAISPTIYESPDNNFFQLLELDKDSEYLPSSLRFMKWECFPFSSLPNTFQGKYLVQLEMDSSKIVQLWEDGEEKVLYKLRFLTFTFSNLRTFDLRLAPNLEQLTIDHCELFEELHIPANHHSKLECLNITCSSLRNLHLGNTSNLKTLELYGCIDLVELQMPAESLKLEHLDLSGSKLKRIHLGRTLNLEQLILDGCNDLVELQMPAESLKLEYLDLTGSKLKTIHLGRTPNLEELILDGCKNLILLLELGYVKCLKELNIQGTGLRRLPLSIFQMKGLRIIGSVEILESCGLKSKIQTSYEEIYCYM